MRFLLADALERSEWVVTLVDWGSEGVGRSDGVRRMFLEIERHVSKECCFPVIVLRCSSFRCLDLA